MENLPEDLLCDIVSRSSVSTVFLCTKVAVRWRNLVLGRSFVRSHLRRSPPSMMIRACLQDAPVLYSYGTADSDANTLKAIPIPLDIDNLECKILGNINGVVCIATNQDFSNFILWNPVRGSILNLPTPILEFSEGAHQAVSIGLSFDDNGHGDIKIIRVLHMAKKTGEGEETVGEKKDADIEYFSKGKWTVIPASSSNIRFQDPIGKIVNCIPYWVIKSNKLVCFDMPSETFVSQDLPWPNSAHMSVKVIGAIKNSVCLLVEDEQNVYDGVWLKNEEGVWIRCLRNWGSDKLIGIYNEQYFAWLRSSSNSLLIWKLDKEEARFENDAEQVKHEKEAEVEAWLLNTSQGNFLFEVGQSEDEVRQSEDEVGQSESEDEAQVNWLIDVGQSEDEDNWLINIGQSESEDEAQGVWLFPGQSESKEEEPQTVDIGLSNWFEVGDIDIRGLFELDKNIEFFCWRESLAVPELKDGIETGIF